MSAVQQAAADLADVLYRQVRQASDQDPGIRGADWRLATVATVGSDGTVTTTDGIVVRRLASYPSPAVADVIIIAVSGMGNWITHGRLVTTSPTDGWTALSASTGWTVSGGDPPAAGRRRADGMIELRGKIRMNTASPPGTMLTLPAAFTPAVDRDFIANTSYGIIALRAQPDSTIINGPRLGTPAINAWVALDTLAYSI